MKRSIHGGRLLRLLMLKFFFSRKEIPEAKEFWDKVYLTVSSIEESPQTPYFIIQASLKQPVSSDFNFLHVEYVMPC